MFIHLFNCLFIMFYLYTYLYICHISYVYINIYTPTRNLVLQCYNGKLMEYIMINNVIFACICEWGEPVSPQMAMITVDLGVFPTFSSTPAWTKTALLKFGIG